MLFTVRPKRRQPSGFILSSVLHGGLAYVLVFSPLAKAVHDRQVMARRYSVLVLRPADFLRPQASPALWKGNHASEAARKTRAAKADRRGTPENREPAEAEPTEAEAAPAPHALRPFELPPVPKRPTAKQTLVELDVPPDIQLKQNIPLPTAVVWEHLPPVRRAFVAPAAKPVSKPKIEMPPAPDLSAPNWEPVISDLKLSAAITNQNPRLIHPPGKTAPLKSVSNAVIVEPPELSTNATGASVAAVISLPQTPLLSDKDVVVPPANQIAFTGSGGSASSGDAHNSANGATSAAGEPGSRGTGTTSGFEKKAEKTGQSAGGSGTQGGARGGVVQGRETAGLAVASAAGGSGSASGIGSAGHPGSGTGVIGVPRIDELPPLIPGTTRLTPPKDGKFSVVVSGSSPAGPYVESAGALSGKMVYSVYISVGLRKKWILQYCLPKAEEQKTAKGRALPIEAPWPYVIVRPETMSFTEYVIVHGILSSEGRFDQLGLIFPSELEKKDLLMSSLKQWTFRAATRDGAPSEVEILLIIPGQSE